jgi:hypothetical protein
MQTSLFETDDFRSKLFSGEPSSFDRPIPQAILNLVRAASALPNRKTRSNMFAWRGQFSPQLIERLLLTYCPKNATILDPFVGSGTVLYEAGCLNLQAYGCELNPSAWMLSKIYEFISIDRAVRRTTIDSMKNKLDRYLFRSVMDISDFPQMIHTMYASMDEREKIVVNALIILLDLGTHPLTLDRICNQFTYLCQIVDRLPYSSKSIISLLGDSRQLPIAADSIDFIITSPPYINVFNYHQNYRRSAEILGWDILEIARSEIGSNRANRSNRFLTVIQYCLDMARILEEMYRVSNNSARIILVVGCESNVLGVPFYNSEIITQIATRSDAFKLVLSQQRQFKNKFGKNIREDLLHLVKDRSIVSRSCFDKIARTVAEEVLIQSLKIVPEVNKQKLTQAINRISNINTTPIYHTKLTQ